MTYINITKFFGASLIHPDFLNFLQTIFCDHDDYNATTCTIESPDIGLEFGFMDPDKFYDDDEGIKFKDGSPVFTYFNIYPADSGILETLPFNLSFADTRKTILEKAGKPLNTTDLTNRFLSTRILIDHFTLQHLAIQVHYEASSESISFIQIRNHTLVEKPMK